MNAIKRFLVLALCLALVVSCFAGCHEKGEIAVVIGDEQFTSGYYACALVFADMDGREKVTEQLGSAALVSGQKIEYWKNPIGGVDYTDWVENEALEKLKLIAGAKKLYKQYEVETSEETNALYKQLFDQLWLDGNVADIMESNGVARETFEDFAYYSYLVDSTFFESYFGLSGTTNLTNPLFEKIYGEGGINEIAADTIKNHLNENYVLVDMINVSFTGLKDEEKKEKENQIESYAQALRDGTKTFEEVYKDYYEVKDEEEKDDASTEEESDEPAPLDEYALPVSKENTKIGYAFDQYEVVKGMKVDEVKTIALEEDKGIILAIKKDILADPYYITAADIPLREEIVGEGYINAIKKEVEGVTCDVNKKSTRQFKVKKIYYPEAN